MKKFFFNFSILTLLFFLVISCSNKEKSGSESKLITDEITNYFSPNTIVVQSKAESDLPLFIDRFFEDETYIYVCQNKTCQRPETNINLALEQVPYIK